jgi:F0F1-type ATP synthase epsilon subunit
MENKFKFTIRTPEQEICACEADSVSFAGDGGELQVFANHASLTASISFTPVNVKHGNKEEQYLVRNGVFLFDNEKNLAMMLALSCTLKSEINMQTMQEYAKFIEEKLKEGKDLSDLQITFLKGEKLSIAQEIEEVS